MKILNKEDIEALIALPPSQAQFKPIDADHLLCELCYELHPGKMVMDHTCGHLFCAKCISEQLESYVGPNPTCPSCKADWSLSNVVDTFVAPPLPLAESILKVKYLCEACNIPQDYKDSFTHHQKCPQLTHPSIRHQPKPAHIPRRGLSHVARVEIISNSFDEPLEDNPRPLIIASINGQQLFSKKLPRNLLATDLKAMIAKKCHIKDVDSVKLFKFSHKLVPNLAKIREFATRRGATHVCALTTFPSLANHTAILNLEEQGAKHYIPPPPPDEVPQELIGASITIPPPDQYNWFNSDEEDEDEPVWIANHFQANSAPIPENFWDEVRNSARNQDPRGPSTSGQ